MAKAVYNRRAWRDVRAVVLERDNYRCRVCGAQAEAVDHIVPVDDGGAHYDPLNLRAICTACNSSRVRRPNRVGTTRRRPSRDWV